MPSYILEFHMWTRCLKQFVTDPNVVDSQVSFWQALKTVFLKQPLTFSHLLKSQLIWFIDCEWTSRTYFVDTVTDANWNLELIVTDY